MPDNVSRNSKRRIEGPRATVEEMAACAADAHYYKSARLEKAMSAVKKNERLTRERSPTQFTWDGNLSSSGNDLKNALPPEEFSA